MAPPDSGQPKKHNHDKACDKAWESEWNRDGIRMEWFKFRGPKVETALSQTSLALRALPAASHSRTLGRDQRNRRVASTKQKHRYLLHSEYTI